MLRVAPPAHTRRTPSNLRTSEPPNPRTTLPSPVSPRVVVVVPCYNTSDKCVPAIAGANAVSDAVLAVNDGSTDDTAQHLAASGCLTVTLPANTGKGAALAAGFRAVLEGPGGLLGFLPDYVVTMDGD